MVNEITFVIAIMRDVIQREAWYNSMVLDAGLVMSLESINITISVAGN